MLTHLQRARQNVDALRVTLQSAAPEDIEASLPKLEEAVQCLQQLVREMQQGGKPFPETYREALLKTAAASLSDQSLADTSEPPLVLQLHALHSSLEVARHLVVHGQTFCDGWAKILGAATGGYQATGDPAPLTVSATVSIKG